MTRHKFVICISWVVFILFILCFEASVCCADQISKVSLRLAWIPGATFVGDYVALDRGYWHQAGIDVSIAPGGFEFDAIKLVAAGVDFFGIASAPQLLTARANGVPVVAIGSTIPESPIGWVSKQKSNIKTPFDFAGKKIGSQFGTHTEITLEALCKKLKIDINSFHRIAMKFDPRPFILGHIDVMPVYIFDQPVDIASQGIELNVIDPGDYGVSLAYGNLYFTTEDFLKNHPEIVRKFLHGAKLGWKWAFDNRALAADVLSKNIADPNLPVLLQKIESMFNFIMKRQQVYRAIFPIEQVELEKTLNILQISDSLPRSISVDKAFSNYFNDN